MKKLVLLLMILSFSNCTNSQSWEKGICDCIEANYNLQSWNYFKEIQSFEKEMIQRGKISKTLDSKIELLDELSGIEYVPFYKNSFSERLLTFGEESIFYCIRRELFNKDFQERHWSERLIKKLKYHKTKLQKDGNIKQYNKEMANSIIRELHKNDGDIQLKNLIILQELYRRIPDEAWYNLNQTELKAIKWQEQIHRGENQRNIIEVLVNGENEIYLKGQLISLEILKDTIKEIIVNTSDNPNLPEDPTKTIIALRNHKNTSYHKYLDVYDELKKANAELREEKSKEFYSKSYDSLNEDELKIIRSQLPFVISESKPDEN